jgi:hypothetical protein
MRIKLLLLFCFLLLCSYQPICQAVSPFQQAQTNLVAGGQEAGLAQQAPLPKVIGGYLNILMGFIGLILFGVIAYGGFLYMTSGGELEKTKKAKIMMQRGVIGLLIIFFAYAISNYVISRLSEAATGQSTAAGR